MSSAKASDRRSTKSDGGSTKARSDAAAVDGSTKADDAATAKGGARTARSDSAAKADAADAKAAAAAERKAPRGAALARKLLVKPGKSFKLDDVDTGATFGHDKDAASELVADTLERLTSLQERLWASKGGPLLIVLQGIDTAGKDGTISHVMTAFNPQGCTVTGFGVPTTEELAHDYLWRVHRVTPGKGSIGIFNRSHYEDVLVVRVHDYVPKQVWSKRYDQINRFEQHLADNGTTILKFFLWISPDEQRERLQARIDTPDKRWKFKSGDLGERKLWDDYVAAYEAALERCSTPYAPWYVIPSDRKWFRNLAVAEIVADALEGMKLKYPPSEAGIESIVVE